MPGYDDFCNCCVHWVLGILVLYSHRLPPSLPPNPPYPRHFYCSVLQDAEFRGHINWLLAFWLSVEWISGNSWRGMQTRKRVRSGSYPSSPCWPSWLLCLSTNGHSLPEALFVHAFSGFLVWCLQNCLLSLPSGLWWGKISLAYLLWNTESTWGMSLYLPMHFKWHLIKRPHSTSHPPIPCWLTVFGFKLFSFCYML